VRGTKVLSAVTDECRVFGISIIDLDFIEEFKRRYL